METPLAETRPITHLKIEIKGREERRHRTCAGASGRARPKDRIAITPTSRRAAPRMLPRLPMTLSKTLQTLRRRRRHMASHLCELVNGFCRIAVVLECRRRQLQPLPRDLERPNCFRAVHKPPRIRYLVDPQQHRRRKTNPYARPELLFLLTICVVVSRHSAIECPLVSLRGFAKRPLRPAAPKHNTSAPRTPSGPAE